MKTRRPRATFVRSAKSSDTTTSSAHAKPSSIPRHYRVFLSSQERAATAGPQGSNDFVIAGNIAHLTVVTARLFDRLLATKLRRHDVPIGQWPFLLFLWASENLSQRQLSQLMAIEESTVTNTVNRMVRDGLISRTRTLTNRRSNQLKLTERGRALLPVLLPEGLSVVETATRGMSDIEIAFLLTLLGKLQSNLADERVRPLALRAAGDRGARKEVALESSDDADS